MGLPAHSVSDLDLAFLALKFTFNICIFWHDIIDFFSFTNLTPQCPSSLFCQQTCSQWDICILMPRHEKNTRNWSTLGAITSYSQVPNNGTYIHGESAKYNPREYLWVYSTWLQIVDRFRYPFFCLRYSDFVWFW